MGAAALPGVPGPAAHGQLKPSGAPCPQGGRGPARQNWHTSLEAFESCCPEQQDLRPPVGRPERGTRGVRFVAQQAADQAGPGAVAQLAAFTRALLFAGADGRQKLKVWVGFHELVITEPTVGAAHIEARHSRLEALGGWIAVICAVRSERLTPPAVRKLAVGVSAAVNGDRLTCALNPSRVTPEEALETALETIGARLVGRAVP